MSQLMIRTSTLRRSHVQVDYVLSDVGKYRILVPQHENAQTLSPPFSISHFLLCCPSPHLPIPLSSAITQLLLKVIREIMLDLILLPSSLPSLLSSPSAHLHPTPRHPLPAVNNNSRPFRRVQSSSALISAHFHRQSWRHVPPTTYSKRTPCYR